MRRNLTYYTRKYFCVTFLDICKSEKRQEYFIPIFVNYTAFCGVRMLNKFILRNIILYMIVY